MSNFKRILALALTMLMVAGCFAAFAGVSAFEDVDEFQDEINVLYHLGIVEGKDAEGKFFDPDAAVTRWQMALLVAKTMTGKVDDAYVNWYSTENFTPFTDVNKDQFFGSMSYANNMGVIIGTTPTTFNPNGGITYQDALTMLVRALGYGSKEMDAGYPWSFINKAIELGIDFDMDVAVNYGTELTRAQVAKLIYNTLYAERYNDPYSHLDEKYSCFARDIFEYEDATVRVMIVAAEGFKLSGTLENVIDADINYNNYDRISAAKKAEYVAFVPVFTDIDENNPYFDAYSNVLVLPASEFGITENARLAIGSVYDVHASDTWYNGVRGFDRCDKLEVKLFDQTQFSFVADKAGNITNVKIDGVTYDTVSELSDYLTDGTKNTKADKEIFAIDANNDMTIMNGTAAPAYNYADLAAYDVNDDGIYDIAYFMSYRVGKCTDEGTTTAESLGAAAGTKTYLFCAYNRINQSDLFIDREGKTVTPVAGTFYLYSQLGSFSAGTNFVTSNTGTMILAKTYSVADSGLVTGIDLNKNTITLNGYDYTDGVWNKGTTYNVGLSNTLGAKVDDMVYNGSLPMSSDLLGIRVQLVIDDVSQRVIAILPVTDPDGSVAIFLRDTGRHITDEKSTIVAVYDLNADIQYINAFDIGDGIEEGDLVKLFERDGKYRIEAYRPNEILTLNGNFEVNAFNFVDYNNLYIMLKDAKVLVYNGATFVEYEGKEFGEGTTATGFAYMVGTAGANNAYNASFIYIMGDADVETVSTVSRATSSIVYIANVPTNYAYQNYDALGGHVYGMAKITVYNAIDAITGEIKTVTFEGEYGDTAASGFYYIDKNNILRQDVYGNLVSANSEMTVYGGATPVCPYEVVYGGNSRYGLDYEPYFVAADGTYVNVKTALAGEVTHGPANCYNGNAAMYTGNAYGSDVIVVFYGPFFG